MTVSADGCLFRNFSVYAGVASANPLGALKVTGTRNHFERMHISGIGHDTMDVAGAYSLMLDGAQENLFERCEIGLDTIGAGTAANSENPGRYGRGAEQVFKFAHLPDARPHKQSSAGEAGRLDGNRSRSDVRELPVHQHVGELCGGAERHLQAGAGPNRGLHHPGELCGQLGQAGHSREVGTWTTATRSYCSARRSHRPIRQGSRGWSRRWTRRGF